MTAHIDLLYRVYREASELVRDLECTVSEEHENQMALASKILAVINDHINPLRDAVDDMEFREKADALADDLAASRMGLL